MNDIQESCAPSWVLRVFNGPLQGSEFNLDEHRTLFLVGDQARFCDQDQPLSIPSDAIYVPLEHDGLNFEVIIEDNALTGVTLRILSDEHTQERLCLAQTVEQVGGLRFAVRTASDTWSEELLAHADAGQISAASAGKSSPLPKWRMAAAGLVAAALLVGGWYLGRPDPVGDVQALISGSSADLQVVKGSDKQVYIFASSERDASWGRQVLERNHKTSQVRVFTYDQEQRRLTQVLHRLQPDLAWHRLDLSDPAKPALVISNQRNLLTPPLQQQLIKGLREAMPYAGEVTLVGHDDKQVSTAAEQGLRRLALPYTRLSNSNSVTFTLEGSLQDTEIQVVRDYVNQFNRQWGDRYVHFAVELKDDWLKGKSFQYGPQGYVKMAPSSWYFPKPL